MVLEPNVRVLAARMRRVIEAAERTAPRREAASDHCPDRDPELAHAAMTLDAAEAALRAMEGIAGEIVIVDNDSGDGSFETMVEGVRTKGWDRVHVLQAGHNGGFGAGNNVGIRRGLSGGVRPDFVYVLNSDAFPEPARSGRWWTISTPIPR